MAGLNKVTVDDIDVKGKKVLVRVDFNVPMKDGVITNDNRIQAALPTIKKLVSEGGKVILCSHLGKPKNGPEAKFSLKAAAERLAELVAPTKVTFVPSDKVVDDSVKAAVDAMQDGEIIVLENTRFRGAEETKNGEEFSKELASLADVFVMDAFGSAHRAHASTAGVTKFVKTTAVGYLMQKEIQFLGNAVEDPVRPFVAILGGRGALFVRLNPRTPLVPQLGKKECCRPDPCRFPTIPFCGPAVRQFCASPAKNCRYGSSDGEPAQVFHGVNYEKMEYIG